MLLGFLYSLGVLRVSDAVQKNAGRLEALTASSGKELHKCAEAKFASTLEHVSEFYGEYAKGVREGSATMQASWDGNAANACQGYFTKFATAIDGQVDPIKKVADECQSTAFGAWSTSKAIGSIHGLDAQPYPGGSYDNKVI